MEQIYYNWNLCKKIYCFFKSAKWHWFETKLEDKIFKLNSIHPLNTSYIIES